jgi:hypothetical protein
MAPLVLIEQVKNTSKKALAYFVRKSNEEEKVNKIDNIGLSNNNFTALFSSISIS